MKPPFCLCVFVSSPIAARQRSENTLLDKVFSMQSVSYQILNM
jgi:hypothetical protein